MRKLEPRKEVSFQGRLLYGEPPSLSHNFIAAQKCGLLFFFFFFAAFVSKETAISSEPVVHILGPRFLLLQTIMMVLTCQTQCLFLNKVKCKLTSWFSPAILWHILTIVCDMTGMSINCCPGIISQRAVYVCSFKWPSAETPTSISLCE